jgi:hypothetical protein
MMNELRDDGPRTRHFDGNEFHNEGSDALDSAPSNR